MIAILDYKAGNQTSVLRALNHLGISAFITADADKLDSCDGIIFPGVGSAAQAMAQLTASGLDAALRRVVAKKQPLLGICLGSQILLEKSDEENTETLGIIKGKCLRFDSGLPDGEGGHIRIPHMGWNSLRKKHEDPILKGIPENAEFYFVHSYYNEPEADLILATTVYGCEFCSIYGRPGLWAAQFHPEKSGKYGLKILANFNEYCESCYRNE